jgi:hypothetical protein
MWWDEGNVVGWWEDGCWMWGRVVRNEGELLGRVLGGRVVSVVVEVMGGRGWWMKYEIGFERGMLFEKGKVWLWKEKWVLVG